MRKLLIVPMLLLPLALHAAVTSSDLPDAVTARLNGTIAEDDISIAFTDESGITEKGNDINLVFDFPVDQDAWEITHTLLLSYSGNLMNAKSARVSFDVSPLKHDDDNVVDTSISLTSEGDNISVDGDSFVLDVPAGYQNSVNFGMLSITVKKGEGQKLAAGSYNGSVVVNMNAT